MNNEIKAILEDIKQWVDSPLDEIDKKYGIWELSYNQSKTLLDYITNLQEENERLKLEIERLNDVLVHKPDEKIMLKTNDGKELFIIQSERIDMQEELNKANMQLMAQLEDYKSRIEKANNFIEENWISYKDSKDFKEFNEVLEVFIKEINELYNILNGRSDE